MLIFTCKISNITDQNSSHDNDAAYVTREKFNKRKVELFSYIFIKNVEKSSMHG